MAKIYGIVLERGDNDFEYWEGFYLTEEEEKKIKEILMKHEIEGWSVRGSRKDVAEEFANYKGEWEND